MRGQYGHGSPSTVMSQANRARFGCQGTGVKLARSGIAAISGSAGTWPISPAAKPAKPAPSVARSSRYAAGISFALGRAYMSTNWAKKNSMPLLVDLLADRIERSLGRHLASLPTWSRVLCITTRLEVTTSRCSTRGRSPMARSATRRRFRATARASPRSRSSASRRDAGRCLPPRRSSVASGGACSGGRRGPPTSH